MILKSGCKINIGLNIIGRREDGYHLLESLFYPVHSLTDLVEVVEYNGDILFSQSGITVDCPLDKNLCVKAYRAFTQRYEIGGAKIHLHKRVPFGAGIGGGSANAAAVIHLLNRIYEIGASDDELCLVAGKVGSDVPFFIHNKPLLVRGTGDIFSPTDIDLTGKYITIIKPDFGISTAKAYSMIKPQTPQISLSESLRRDWKQCVVNAFEEPIFALNPRMKEIKEKLYALGSLYVSMSGSGSAIYAISSQPLAIENYFDHEFIHSGILSSEK